MLYPTVSSFRNTLHVPVFLAAVPAPDAAVGVFVAPFFLPKGTYDIVWSLLTLELQKGKKPFEFEEVGITFEDWRQEKLKRDDSCTFRVSPTQWKTRFDNQVESWGLVVHYKLNLIPPSEGTKYVLRPDPSIAISKDPIEPPIRP